MYKKDVIYDSDCLVCFLAVRQCGILKKLFSKVIVPAIVEKEILNPRTPPDIRYEFNRLKQMDFVEVKHMQVGSKEHALYKRLQKKFKFLGKGESAVIAITCQCDGVIASNNLLDVMGLVEDYNLNLVTTAFILAKAYENGVKSRKELDGIGEIWLKMVVKGHFLTILALLVSIMKADMLMTVCIWDLNKI